MLRIDGVSVSIGPVSILRSVSMEIATGQFAGLIGRNGAGKTTLLRTMAGFSRPGRGSVRIFGHPPRDPRARSKSSPSVRQRCCRSVPDGRDAPGEPTEDTKAMAGSPDAVRIRGEAARTAASRRLAHGFRVFF